MIGRAFALCGLLGLPVFAQDIPNVQCSLEDYPVKAVVAWQFPQTLTKVQVAVLRDPTGEQEARFDLLHGASLISLRYRGKELLFGEAAGASVSLFSTRHSSESELKHLPAYWSAYSPDQGGSSMGIPATTTGIACQGLSSFRAFATMVDRGVDNSFQANPLLGLDRGRISDNFPPGYSTPFVIETEASWIKTPTNSPAYYLQLSQTVVNTRPGVAGPLEWYLNAAAPWPFSHTASYPQECSDKSPCDSSHTGAIASGRYEDSALSNGLAVVAPAGAWRTSRAYIRDNAEYVVLLYNAVWAAPRRTFALVFEHGLDGLEAFSFKWYVCAGPWGHAQNFAQLQPRAERPRLNPDALLAPTAIDKAAVRIACETTTFKPQPDQEDHAVVLRDPAGEQTVLFDTTQGGAIVSLKYHEREHIWGYNGGGLLQMAFHNGMKNGAWSGDYNPTQAGDGSAMSPVTGIACNGKSDVTISTTMLDFNHNNGFYQKPLIAVWGGRVNDMVPLSYSSPYVLETHAHWIRNPAGAPQYYLELEHTLVHVADETIGRFGFDFAAYEPWDFAVRAESPAHCPCPSDKTTYMAGGWYTDESRETGLAVAMPSSNFPNKRVGGGFNSDYMWRNRNFHLSSSDSLDGISAKSFRWFVMPGPWRNALSFAQSLK